MLAIRYGVQNYNRIETKHTVEEMPLPFPTPITFDRVDEIQSLFMNFALCHVRHAGSRIHKILKFHQLFQKLLEMEGGGGGALLSVSTSNYMVCRAIMD